MSFPLVPLPGSDGTQFSGYPLVTTLQSDDLVLLQRLSAPGPIGTVAIPASALGGASIYDIATGFPGVIPPSSTLIVFDVVRAMSLPAGLTGSAFAAQTAPTASTALTLQQNGTPIGTLTWGAGSSLPTVSFTAAVHFAINDQLRIVSPSALNGLAGYSGTLVASLP